MALCKKKANDDPNPVQPVKKYRDREGRQRFQGTGDLKPTEPGPRGITGKVLADFFLESVSFGVFLVREFHYLVFFLLRDRTN